MSGLVPRLRDYFSRQIAWFEKMDAELEGAGETMENGENALFLLQQEAHEKGTRRLEEELASLLPEWEAAQSVTSLERDELHTLAQEAARLAGVLQGKMEQRASKADARARAIAETLSRMRRGKGLVNSYRPQDRQRPKYVDRDV